MHNDNDNEDKMQNHRLNPNELHNGWIQNMQAEKR